MKKEMITENYCDNCDDVLHAVFDTEDFFDYKVGAVRCKCGCVVMPCSDCPLDHIRSCANCPYKNAKVVDAMTDEEYVSWLKENEKETYDLMLKGEMGENYEKVAKKVSQKK